MEAEALHRLAAELVALLAERHARGLVEGNLGADRILWNGLDTIRFHEEPGPPRGRAETLPEDPGLVKDPAADGPEEAQDRDRRGSGEPLDLPPESGGASPPSTTRVEVWQFGLLLYRAALGKHPLRPGGDLSPSPPRPSDLPPISTLREDLGREWDGFLANCLHDRPEERLVDGLDLQRAYLADVAPSRQRPEASKSEGNRMPGRIPALFGYPGIALLFLLFLLLFELPLHGRSQDDLVQRRRGEQVLKFLETLDRSHLPAGDPMDLSKGDRYYGPLAVTLALALGPVLAPLAGDPSKAPYLDFHAGLCPWTAFLLLGLMFLGRRLLGNHGGGLLAALAFCSFPRLWEFFTVNPGDLPAAALGVWTILSLARWFERPSLSRLAVAALFLGGTAAVRPPDAGILAVALLLTVLLEARHRKRTGTPPLPLLQVLAAPFLCWGAWVLLWPGFWSSPILAPLEVVLGYLTERGPYVTQSTLWFGELVDSPRGFVWVQLLFSTPLPILFLLLLGLSASSRLPSPFRWGLLLWFLLTTGKHLTGMANHGGVRHFLSAFVPLSILAALGLERLCRGLPRPRLRGPLAVAVGLVLAFWARSTHPFEGSYYNAFLGGTEGAAGRFDLDQDGSATLPLIKDLLPELTENDALFVVGGSDLVTQLTLPRGVPVVEILPDRLELLRDRKLRSGLRNRRLILLFVQDRHWGRLDPFFARGELREILRVGPSGLPLGLACEILGKGFWEHLPELFES